MPKIQNELEEPTPMQVFHEFKRLVAFTGRIAEAMEEQNTIRREVHEFRKSMTPNE